MERQSVVGEQLGTRSVSARPKTTARATLEKPCCTIVASNPSTGPTGRYRHIRARINALTIGIWALCHPERSHGRATRCASAQCETGSSPLASPKSAQIQCERLAADGPHLGQASQSVLVLDRGARLDDPR